MMEKNKGISVLAILYHSLYVSAWQGRKHRCAICVISNEPLFKVHILFFFDIFALFNGRSCFLFASLTHLLFLMVYLKYIRRHTRYGILTFRE